MAFDLTTAKERLGITDNSKDDVIHAALNSALADAEKYCDRNFAWKADVTQFLNVDSKRELQLPRYPVEQLLSVMDAGRTFQLHHSSGRILFDGPITSRTVTIEYVGGFRILPANLEIALWMIFNAYYELIDNGITSSSSMDSISITGVGSINYHDAEEGLMSNTAKSILDGYKNFYA